MSRTTLELYAVKESLAPTLPEPLGEHVDDKQPLNPELFSDEFAAKLASAPIWDPTRFLLLLVVPPLLTWSWVLPPYLDPDQSYDLQGWWKWYGQIISAVLCHCVFPPFLTQVAGVRRDWYVELNFHLWTWISAILSTAFRVVLTTWTRTFPFPLASPLAAGWCVLNLPGLWMCIPHDQRADPGFRKRAACAFVGILAILCFYGMAVPMMNVAVFKLPAKFQALLILLYTIADSGFDCLGAALSRHIGADAMPCFLFAGTSFFEFNMNIAFAGGFDPIVFAEGMALDILKHAYEFYCLLRIESERSQSALAQGNGTYKATPTGCVDDPEELANLEVRDAHLRARGVHLVCMILLRLLVQILVPLHFLTSFLVVRAVRPEFSDVVCTLSDGDFKFTAWIMWANIVVQSLVLLLTVVFVRAYGYSPIQLLQGLLQVHFSSFLTSAVCASTFYMSLQFAHAGNDLTLIFLWVRDRKARWRCGLQWAPGA